MTCCTVDSQDVVGSWYVHSNILVSWVNGLLTPIVWYKDGRHIWPAPSEVFNNLNKMYNNA
jgi:hypothetical protein